MQTTETIEPIAVFNYNGHYYVTSGNRKLYLYKKPDEFRVQKFKKIPVIEGLCKLFQKKIDPHTMNDGQ